MDITNKDDRKIVSDIIQHYQIDEPLCLKSICKEYNNSVINGIIERKYAFVIKEKTDEQYKSTFYKLIQVCSFVYELFNKRYVFADLSVKNQNPNDYTNDGYPYFSFNENGGDFQLGKFIADFWSIPLIPTSQLIHLKENKFISTEERRYKGQLKASYFATFVALIIGVSSLC